MRKWSQIDVVPRAGHGGLEDPKEIYFYDVVDDMQAGVSWLGHGSLARGTAGHQRKARDQTGQGPCSGRVFRTIVP